MTKNTALTDEHKALGAKLIPFAGWLMPLQYRGIIQEHYAVRQNAGLFDVSHMGEFFVSGKDACEFLNSIVPQDIAELNENKVIYCQLTNEEGGIIDDLLIYKIADDNFLLVVNASRISIDYNWIVANKKDFKVQIENKSDEYSLIALQGPNASAIMDKIGFKKELQPEFMHFANTSLYGIETFISRTGYTGEDGFELLVKNEDALKIWQNLLTDGKELKLEPIGLGARDTLRLEAALPLHGNELNEKTTPIEAGLKWCIPKDKEADYIGKNKILDQIQNGTDKKLVGFELIERGIARSGDKIIENGKLMGMVTSGTMSPMSRKPFGMAYVSDTNLKIDDTFKIEIRGNLHLAKIVKRPFVKKSYVRKENT